MKESEAGEAALQLQFAEKRVASLETHVGSLNGSIKRLEEELDASAKVTWSSMLLALPENSSTSCINFNTVDKGFRL